MKYISPKVSSIQIIPAVLLFFFLLSLPLAASEFRGDNDITIDKDEIISDDLYTVGEYAEIRGTIDGDLTAFGYEISSNGNITGNANLFAYDIDFIGKVDHSARMFANKIRSNGPINGNLLAFAQDIKLGQKSYIGRDFTFGCVTARLDGIIIGNVSGGCERAVISGQIDGDVDIETEQLIITSPAVINGNLTYKSKEEAIIDEGVVINGETVWHEGDQETDKKTDDNSYLSKFLFFIAALLTGLVLILLFKSHINEAVRQLEVKFWETLAVGCLAFLGLTFGWIIPFVLIIGIPISVMMLSLGLILFYIGKIYIAIALAKYLYGLINRGTRLPIGVELIIGLIILSVLFELPVIGWVIYIGAFLLGTGAAVNGFRSQCKRMNAEKAESTTADVTN